MILGDCVAVEEISSGYSFRGKVEPQQDGKVGILQMKDITDDYYDFKYDAVDRSSAYEFKEKFILKDKDILFVSKGANNYAVLFKEQEFPCVASGTFFVIRVDQTKIVPAYLVWYINQSKVQSYLTERKAGTYVLNLTKQDVIDIPLQMPNYDLQQKIGDFIKLYQREQQLEELIKSNKQQFIQKQLLNLIDHE
ncbi:restriction endonuclease subunit S [Myroides odoratimimus]|uniref:restriction endonuclease subunit S n=1 Tax=Myroides odoratimimus TaxID=76832 RepID=UPI001CE03184|nr:restriction endonuclease subunit S [Myroides odoratimimus]MCA4792692.1 restriction endonuclease subunit S [Myroides odoratimimus]MCA4819866.1 restriction endonuclease subunit S [Myroides odoratimimus]MDM1401237.1 restriction endonuclease subunit S [Myroides odoratimimus]MDM1457213.1 restriction endonuclease subunit S [Myroides odoratimimus]MEC4085768.1 restriction endonuclease subunit S [Myroides odoratimimus]